MAEIEIALAVERADDLALALAVSGDRDGEFADAAQPVEIHHIAQQWFDLHLVEIEIRLDRRRRGAAIEHHLALAGALIERELRQIGLKPPVLQMKRKRAVADLDLAVLQAAGAQVEIGI